MKTLKDHIETHNDLKRREEISLHHFYNLNNQAIILDFITKEITLNQIFYSNESILRTIESSVKISKDVTMLMELYKWMRDIRQNHPHH